MVNEQNMNDTIDAFERAARTLPELSIPRRQSGQVLIGRRFIPVRVYAYSRFISSILCSEIQIRFESQQSIFLFKFENLLLRYFYS